MAQYETRKGCKDIWNAFMVEGADFSKSKHDIPMCPTTAKELPTDIITYTEAKAIYRKQLKLGNKDFKNDSYVCFYEDDYKFDSSKGIWHFYEFADRYLKHFAGIITPDFSTYQDFPEPLKKYNTYRMRAFGYWQGRLGNNVINNVRWGTKESWDYCFDGIPKNSIVAIGTVGSGIRHLENRSLFDEGFMEMIKRLKPHAIIVYGSSNYPIFNYAELLGINIVSFQSKTAKDFAKRVAI